MARTEDFPGTFRIFPGAAASWEALGAVPNKTRAIDGSCGSWLILKFAALFFPPIQLRIG